MKEEWRHKTATQAETIKHKHKKQVSTSKTKHSKHKHKEQFTAKRETGKITKGDMIKTSERYPEKITETKKPAESLKSSKETDLVTEISNEKNVLRQKNDLKDHDKKHVTSKHHHIARNRDSWREKKRFKIERERSGDKTSLSPTLDRNKNKETERPDDETKVTLKNKDTTTNSYTSMERGTMLAERPNEYIFCSY